MIFNVPGHIDMIRIGLHFRAVSGFIVKTQTRRLNRGIYQIGKSYAVQRKRGVKAEVDIRIVMDRIWEEYCFQVWLYIHPIDALAEGGYKSDEFERVFRELNPEWNGKSRWAFEFHVVEVRI